MDDHYIPNPSNAHIRTEEFEQRLRDRPSFTSKDVRAFCQDAYEEVERSLQDQPESASADALICRYVSLAKFADFVCLKELYFPEASRFDDEWDCRVPADYDVATRKLLFEMGVRHSGEWYAMQRENAAAWNISCWTKLAGHFDDNLLWQAYAGGATGVGVTIRFKELSDFIGTKGPRAHIYGGKVSYDALKLLPFNKHKIFRNENEVRFAFKRTPGTGPGITISIHEIFNCFGIRLSPASTERHASVVHMLWKQFGGSTEKVQRPGR